MVKHIVFFKLKDNSKEVCDKAIEVLLSMRGNVPSALKIEAGVDFLHQARSFDLALLVDVADREALETYDKDEYHCSVVKTHMHAICEKTAAVDYEF